MKRPIPAMMTSRQARSLGAAGGTTRIPATRGVRGPAITFTPARGAAAARGPGRRVCHIAVAARRAEGLARPGTRPAPEDTRETAHQHTARGLGSDRRVAGVSLSHGRRAAVLG